MSRRRSIRPLGRDFRHRTPGRHRRRPAFEGLEDRTLLTGDPFEPDNSLAQAALLNVQTGSHYYSSLSIDVPSDLDYYKFTIQSGGRGGTSRRSPSARERSGSRCSIRAVG